MQIISVILSIPVTVILVLWIKKLKKDNPFPKGSIVRALVLGAIAVVLATVCGYVVALIRAIIEIGPEAFTSISIQDRQSIDNLGYQIMAISDKQEFSLLRIFANTFITIGLFEELFKLLMMKVAAKKNNTAQSWFDMVLVGALVGLGFQLFEDITFSNGGIAIAVVRALTPFHFVFGSIMGYLYGKAEVENKNLLSFLAILVPSLIHSIYDSSVTAYQKNDSYLAFELVCIVVMCVLFVVSIFKIRKWHKNKTLDVRLNG
ncbi:MAG: PrsW family intramembrane metalloprotease [Butyrivibrio sp.]|uniref:PrsW family glutamic-type intramembrane protease n=1 Tax=Butyrivibrio sp. TaxID=28121 RepID=UPI001B19B13F|nr:PrsW family glutamic-type intramembrane protease [Butyrivibrio sp.]MBO6242667.1 PrsW family intramembrane metalloprotease [Butyrivibrio sp.]